MNLGDKVTILPRNIFKHNSKYKHTYTCSMEQYEGKIFTVSEKYNKEYFRLKEDDGFIWHKDWLRLEDNFLSEEEMTL
jgi:hypothetical protein